MHTWPRSRTLVWRFALWMTKTSALIVSGAADGTGPHHSGLIQRVLTGYWCYLFDRSSSATWTSWWAMTWLSHKHDHNLHGEAEWCCYGYQLCSHHHSCPYHYRHHCPVNSITPLQHSKLGPDQSLRRSPREYQHLAGFRGLYDAYDPLGLRR